MKGTIVYIIAMALAQIRVRCVCCMYMCVVYMYTHFNAHPLIRMFRIECSEKLLTGHVSAPLIRVASSKEEGNLCFHIYSCHLLWTSLCD